jgi:beta-aspartyl-peptidase (threonine type)
MRAGTARSVVLYLKAGYKLADACREAFRDLGALGVPAGHNLMNMVALDCAGRHFAVTTVPGRTYAYQADGMAAPATLPRTIVATE